MKIALINENSQAAKNALIEETLRKVVEPMGHEVVNYGMYTADDAAQLTYVQNGILAAVLLNAGRGSAVDCAALAEVLSDGHLLGAGMDVTAPEPLPPEHPLWDAPRALITPHTAGGYDHMALTLDNLASLFLDNLNRWRTGQPLRSRMK